MKNFGKMSGAPIQIGDMMYYQPVLEDGTPWKDAAEEKKGTLFIAVGEDGYIYSAESDPTMILISGVDIWQIETSAEREDVIAKHWDGKTVK